VRNFGILRNQVELLVHTYQIRLRRAERGTIPWQRLALWVVVTGLDLPARSPPGWYSKW